VAQAKFIDNNSFELTIQKTAANTQKIATAILQAGAGVIADKMRENLVSILSENATGQLVAGFGVSPVQRDRQMNFNVHLGFDGYHEPGHVPLPLLARTIESGVVMGGRYTVRKKGKRNLRIKRSLSASDYFRAPTPFAKPAVEQTKQQARDAMDKAAQKEFEKLKEV
jgi:hypothetical protein